MIIAGSPRPRRSTVRPSTQHDGVGDLAVQRFAFVVACAATYPLDRRRAADGGRRVRTRSTSDGRIGAQPHHTRHPTRGSAARLAAAEHHSPGRGDDAAARRSASASSEHLGLEVAEGRLAVGRRRSRARCVRCAPRSPRRCRRTARPRRSAEHPGHGRLADTHQPDEHEVLIGADHDCVAATPRKRLGVADELARRCRRRTCAGPRRPARGRPSSRRPRPSRARR